MQDTKLSSLYTTDTNKMKMHMRHTKHSSQENLKIRVRNHQEHLEDH